MERVLLEHHPDNIDYALYCLREKERYARVPARCRPEHGQNVRFSLVMPVYNPGLSDLKEAVESVIAQTCTSWTLHIVDDCSTDERVLDFLESIAHPRVTVDFSEKNLGISGATNLAISRARGDYIGFIDHDDILRPWALDVIEDALSKRSTWPKLIYTDRDFISTDGRREEPFFKPGFSLNYLLSGMYLIHFLLFRRDVLNSTHAFDEAYDGAQDFDFALRVTELCRDYSTDILHVPQVCYGWRKARASTARTYKNKMYAFRAGQRAVNQYLQRNRVGKITAVIDREAGYGFYRLVPGVKETMGSRGLNILVAFYSMQGRTGEEPKALRFLPTGIKAIASISRVNMAREDWWQEACETMASWDEGPSIIVWENAHIGVMAWRHILWHLHFWPTPSLYSPRVILEDEGRHVNFLNGPYILEDGRIFNPLAGFLATRRQRHAWHMSRRDTFPPVFPFVAGQARHLASLDADTRSFPDAYGLVHHYIRSYFREGLNHIYLPGWCIYVKRDIIQGMSRSLTETGRNWLLAREGDRITDPYFNRNISTKRPDIWISTCDDFFDPWPPVRKGCSYIYP